MPSPTDSAGPVLLAMMALFLVSGCTGDDATGTEPAASPPVVTATSGSNCPGVNFTLRTTVSDTIGTVGIVQWSTSVPVTTAWIDFGRDPSDYEFRAPVNEPSSNNRTLLLGMKASTTYSFRIVAEYQEDTCASDVQEIATGPLRNGLTRIELNTPRPEEAYGGFTVACQLTPVGPDSATPRSSDLAFIFDADGDIVWWYRGAAAQGCARARMSYDGEYLWMGNANVGARAGGILARVRMDGTEVEAFSLPLRHHDFAVLPDESLAYIEYADADLLSTAAVIGAEGCDVVKELDPSTGESTVVYEVATANPGRSISCHSNAINWWPDKERYTLSVLYWDSILAFDREGSLAWTFGGQTSDYTGAEWDRQHQHHWFDDHLLLFNNNGDNGSSAALEYQLGENSAELVSSYSSSAFSQTFGGVQHLSNGNTLVTFSNAGVMHEVNPSGELVQEITTGVVGYAVRRKTLYGPPPPYAE
jgi:hypothetical protein